MRNKRVAAVVVIAMAVIVAAGGLMASNMGFKLNYTLLDGSDAGSNSGTQTVGLPYNRQVGLDLASDVFKDIGLGTNVCHLYACNCLSTVSKYNTATDALATYACKGGPAGDYALEPGEGLQIGMVSGGGGDYIIVGSHNPGLTVSLIAAGAGSASGTNYYTHPYHGVATNARELFIEIGGVQFLNFHRKLDDGFEVYTFGGGTLPPDGPALQAGAGIIAKVAIDRALTPSHY